MGWIREEMANIAAIIAKSTEVDAGSFANKLVNTVELKRKLTELKVTGDFIGGAEKFNNLPIISSGGKTAVNGDWAILTANDGIYNKGIYLYDGNSYTFGQYSVIVHY